MTICLFILQLIITTTSDIFRLLAVVYLHYTTWSLVQAEPDRAVSCTASTTTVKSKDTFFRDSEPLRTVSNMSRPIKMMNAGADNYAPSAFQFPLGAPSSTKRKADDQVAPEESQEKRRKISARSTTKRKKANSATTVEPSSKRQKLAAAAPAPHAKYAWDDFNSPIDRPKISPKAPSKHKPTVPATSDEVPASRPKIQPKSGNRLKRKATENGNDCVKRWRVDTPLTTESDEEEATAKASEEGSSTDSTEAPRAGDGYPTPEQAGGSSPPPCMCAAT